MSAVVCQRLIGILRKLRVDELELECRQPSSRKRLVADPKFNHKKQYTQKGRTCQQSVMNSSQKSARRFCVSAEVSLKRAQSRSATDEDESSPRSYGDRTYAIRSIQQPRIESALISPAKIEEKAHALCEFRR